MSESLIEDRGKAKLDPEHKEYILQRLAEGDKPAQIAEEIKKLYSISISEWTVRYYSRTEEKRILEKRRALATQLDRIASTHKFIRLKELEERRQHVLDTTFRDKDGREDHKAKERLFLDHMEQVRKEAEGFKGIAELGDDPFAVVAVVGLDKINEELKKIDKDKESKDKE